MLPRCNSLRFETLEARRVLAGFDPLSAGGLDGPWDSQFGPDSNGDAVAELYVSSRDADEILRYDGATGVFLDVFVEAGSGGLEEPAGMQFGPDNNLYVVSRGSMAVLRFDGQTGTFIDEFVPSADRRLERPRVPRFGPDGNLYVTDDLFEEVHRFDGVTGDFLNTFVTSFSGGLENPTDMAWGPNGDLYVTSSRSNINAVLRYDGTSGAFIDQFVASESGGLDGPAHLQFREDGFLYVSAWRSDAIFRYDADTGAFVDEFITSNAAGMDSTTGFAFGEDGNLYVASRGTDEILTFAGPESPSPGEFLEAFVSAGTPPQPIDPLGSLISQAVTDARIGISGDVDLFPFSASSGQTMTLIATPTDANLRLQLSLENSAGVVDSTTAGGAGESIVLQTIGTADGGTFAARVEDANGQTGKYTLELILNAAVEDENFQAGDNNSRDNAQNLDASFVALPGGGQRGAVIGQSEGELSSQTYFPFDTPLGIPDEFFTFSTVDVADNGIIADVNVSLDITHPFVSDLAASVMSPQGTEVDLFFGVGEDGADMSGAVFDEQAATGIIDGQAPFDGSTDASGGRYRPEGSLSQFDGEVMAGEWTLFVGDLFFLDQGALNDWSLEISTRSLAEDYYSVTLEEGQSFGVQLHGADGVRDLEIQDASGTALAALGDADEQLSGFTAPAAGTYFVRVLSSTDYTLLLLRDGVYADPAADSFASAQPLGSGQSVIGRLNSQYELTSPGNIAAVEAEAIGMGGQLVTINDQREQELVLDLFEGNENGFLFYIGATDRDEEGVWTWMSGQPFLFDGWQPGEPNDAGEGEDFAAHDRRGWNDERGQANRRGIVEFGGRHFFSIELAEGEVLRLTTETPRDDLDAETDPPNLFDPRLRLYNSQEVLLAEDDDSAADAKNSFLEFAVPDGAAGSYFIELLPSEKFGGTTEGEFSLKVELNPPAHIPGDFNGNGTVEQADLDLVLLNWGNSGSDVPETWIGPPPTGSIDQDELDAILLNWGASQAIQSPARQAAFAAEPNDPTLRPLASLNEFATVQLNEPTRLARTIMHRIV